MISNVSTVLRTNPTMTSKDRFYKQKKAIRDLRKRAVDINKEGKKTRVKRWTDVLDTVEKAFVEEVEALEIAWNTLRGEQDDLEEVKIAEVEVMDEDLDDVFRK